MSSSKELSLEEWKGVLNFSMALARDAGQVIVKGSDDILRSAAELVEEKKNSVDLVTKYDKEVEKLVMERCKETYPMFAFIGEEETSTLGKLPLLTDEPTFCVDPIDGTTNFVHGFPYACISIGVIYKKRPFLGVIYNPFVDWMYYGLESQGSFMTRAGGEPIRLPLSPPRPLPSLSQALLAVEWGSDRTASTMKAKSESFARLAGDGSPGQIVGGKMAHSLRSVGSAALNYAHVACGSLDMYWEIGCWPWDVTAGIVIAQEAGALVNTSDLKLSGGEVTGDASDEVLTGRKYIVIRAIAGNASESGRDIQMRLIKEFCETVIDVEPN